MSFSLHLQWNSVVWSCWEVGTGPACQPPGWPSNERHAAAEPQRLPVQAPADWDVDSERADQTTADDIIFPRRGPRRSSHPRPTPFPLLPLFCGRRRGESVLLPLWQKGPALRRCVTPRSRGVFWRKWRRWERRIDVAGNVLNQRRASALVSSSTRRACKSQTAAGRRLWSRKGTVAGRLNEMALVERLAWIYLLRATPSPAEDLWSDFFLLSE